MAQPKSPIQTTPPQWAGWSTGGRRGAVEAGRGYSYYCIDRQKRRTKKGRTLTAGAAWDSEGRVWMTVGDMVGAVIVLTH